MTMANSRTLLITTFNDMALKWVIAHPVLGKRVHPVNGFITMDEHEHITVWIGYFDEPYCESILSRISMLILVSLLPYWSH